MAKKRLNIQDKHLAASKTEESSADIDISFDFPCVNDYCSARNGKRVDGWAWKTEIENVYETFCCMCGQGSRFSKEEFKIKKEEVNNETIKLAV